MSRQAPASSCVEPPVVHALTRPTSTARRWRGRIERVVAARRRVAVATGSGLLAAALTVVALSSLRSAADPAGSPTGRSADAVPMAATGADRSNPVPPPPVDAAGLDPDQRIIALERSSIALPVGVGAFVEVVGFRPTVTGVQAEVIASRVEVVGLTDEAVLVAVDAEAAYTIGEIAAIGRVTVLGRGLPAG